MVKLSDVIIKSAKQSPSNNMRRWFLGQLLTVTDPAGGGIAADIFKAIIQPGDVASLSPTRSHGYNNANHNMNSDYIIKMHPEMFRAWLTAAWSQNAKWASNKSALTPHRVARQLYVKNLSQAQRNAYVKILKETIPKNSEWMAMFENYTGKMHNVNRTKPCTNVHAIIVDRRRHGLSRNVRYEVGGGSVPVRIQPTVPEDVLLDFGNGSIQLCEFAFTVFDRAMRKANDKRAASQIDVFLLDHVASVIGAATCTIHKDSTLEVDYLCSARKCKGGGTIIMSVIETFAMSKGLQRVKLFSNARATQFYKKIGYRKVPETPNVMEKVLGNSRAKRNRSPSGNALHGITQRRLT